jgi:hypothetical protein
MPAESSVVLVTALVVAVGAVATSAAVVAVVAVASRKLEEKFRVLVAAVAVMPVTAVAVASVVFYPDLLN